MPSPCSFECGQSGGVVQGHGRHPVGAWPLRRQGQHRPDDAPARDHGTAPSSGPKPKASLHHVRQHLGRGPPVIDHVHKFIERLKLYIEDRALPVEVIELVPEHEQTFWSNLIGRGYPTPVREFRWCTDRMKIRPAQRFIEEHTDVFGNPPVVHFLLGTRFDESTARKATMDAHTRMDSDLHAHGTIPTASTIRPIEDWSTDDVWSYLLKLDWANGMPNPFADINQDLSMLYRDAAGGECPVIHDPSQQTCAGSRFGCWTCTVVAEDKSLNQMIATEKDIYDVTKLAKLAAFRDRLARRAKRSGKPSSRAQPTWRHAGQAGRFNGRWLVHHGVPARLA